MEEKPGHLVIGRRRREKVFLDVAGVRIEVKIEEVRGGLVRLGITAPRCVEISREDMKDGK